MQQVVLRHCFSTFVQLLPMNQLKICILCLMLPMLANAQTEKGTQLVGANISLNSKSSDIDSNKNVGSSSYNLNLRYGRFLANNFAMGVSVPLTYSKIGAISDLSYAVGPFARYYSPFEETEEASKMYLLIEARLTYGQNYYNNKDLKLQRTTSFLGGGGGFGVIYFFNESVGMETLLDYTFLNSLSNKDQSGGFALNIGFQIYLNKYGF